MAGTEQDGSRSHPSRRDTAASTSQAVDSKASERTSMGYDEAGGDVEGPLLTHVFLRSSGAQARSQQIFSKSWKIGCKWMQ